jgi:hypothetical protein
VQFQQFTYPAYGVPLVEAYGGAFESVFVVLHPFVRVPDRFSWSATRQYPNDSQIIASGMKFPWTNVAQETGLTSCARINQALLTSIGSLVGDLTDPSGRDTLQSFFETGAIWMPTEGRFEPLLQSDFVQVFATNGIRELVFVPDFPDSDPVVRLSIAELEDGKVPFPSCGTLLAPDASFLFTVDWDSFFTLFYGPRAFIARAVHALDLEGFFATPNTEHSWFNYSFGCATVTISPEDWQTTATS